MLRPTRLSVNLWYTGTLTAILCLFSILLYAVVSTALAKEMDRTLELYASSVEKSIFAFWKAESAARGSGPGNWVSSPPRTLGEVLDQEQLPNLIDRWIRTGQLETGRPIRLLDSVGRSLGNSSSFAGLDIPVTSEALAGAETQRHAYETFRLPDQRIRLLTRAVESSPGRGAFFVQVAASLLGRDSSLAKLRSWLIVLVPSTVLITGAIGMVLLSTSLGPLRGLVMRTQRLSEELLHLPIGAPKGRDELERLSVIMNEMLTRLEPSFRRLRQFSAAAAHELRTALTVMKGEIGMALHRPRSAEEYQKLMATHLESINEMAATVEELLNLAHWEATEVALDQQSLELGELVQQVSRPFRVLAAQKSINVDVSSYGAIWVRAERRLLERVVSNLVDNAVKYTPRGGSVRVFTDLTGAEGRLIVRDTGPGIPAEDLPHIYDRFFRRRTEDSASTASGLGLGLCRWIIEAHGGRIEAVSQPGQGTTFTVSLPRTSGPS